MVRRKIQREEERESGSRVPKLRDLAVYSILVTDTDWAHSEVPMDLKHHIQELLQPDPSVFEDESLASSSSWRINSTGSVAMDVRLL